MTKKLSDMTLEELWQLFPIRLAPHSDDWTEYFKDMESMLTARLKSFDVIRIEHIGSTAISNIMAKPIVDILVEIPNGGDMSAVARAVEAIGFLKMSESEKRVSFNYGYTENGFAEKVYHLHLRYRGDNDELYFRDFLNAHPEIAKEYEDLKIRLAEKFEYDRDAYTQAKTDFIKLYTAQAKTAYKDRFN